MKRWFKNPHFSSLLDGSTFQRGEFSFDAPMGINRAILVLDLDNPAPENRTIVLNGQEVLVAAGTTQLIIPVMRTSSFSVSGSVAFQSGALCGELGFLGEFPCQPKLLVISIIGDLNNDFLVDGGDLSILLQNWGNCSACEADMDQNGQVDVLDLVLLLDAWKTQ